MIVLEERLKELFDLLPEIQIKSQLSRKPVFSWGRKEELNRYIETEKSDSYPLIWLLQPQSETHNRLAKRVTQNVILILATLETRKDLFNQQRWQGSYKNVLNPLAEYVIQALENSSITRLQDSTNITILKEPNYSDSGKNGTIDEWDALRIECEVEFNDNCLNTIKWI
jgi:hypothetical protein